MARFSQDDFLLRSAFGLNWYVKDEGNKTHIGVEQDCTGIIEANKRQQVSGGSGWNSDKSWRWAARIPLVVQQKWLLEHGIDIHNPDHERGVQRLLNSNEYRYLRPFEWRI